MNYQHKRGATLSLSGAITSTEGEDLPDFAQWVPTAEIRLLNDTVVDTIEVEWLDEVEGTIKLFKKDTKAWPLGIAEIDVRFTDAEGAVVLTTTESLTIVKEITRA
jgi:hypothetical protein